MPVDLKLDVPIMCACMHVCASVCSMQISAEERWKSICVSACMRTYVFVYVRVCECMWMAQVTPFVDLSALPRVIFQFYPGQLCPILL
jgi:hypothetical protein